MLSIMDNEQPHQELVKCVLVGDTAVGKTRLICARACNKHVSLSQLLSTHVPTVWAIDQYRIYKDVLERSWEVVDGVNVSLRLWDTFGDHEKDRRFAYGRSDVVLLCFSVTSPVSLRNCKAMWYPEIRRFCPQVPVLLVGCKNDLRYMYREEAYLNIFKEHSPFVRATRKSDLVMPDQARAIARDLGVQYYETSVLSYYGVIEVFENAIRSALMARRQQRFWMPTLKKVQRPLLQAPFLPPKPLVPEIHILASCYDDQLRQLWLEQAYTDVIFVAGSVGFSAHRFMLAAASPALHHLLTSDLSAESNSRRPSQTFGESTTGDFNDDTETLIRPDNTKPSRVWDQLKRRSNCQDVTVDSGKHVQVCRELNHPAFTAMCIQQCEGLDHRGQPTSSVQTVITLSKMVTPQAMQQCLHFIYTGKIDSRFCESQTLPIGLLLEIRQAAELFEIPQLVVYICNLQSREEFLNADLEHLYKKSLRNRLLEVCMRLGCYADVVFQLDDGTYSAHRPLLMARCDMFGAMFSGDFAESSAKVIAFPGVRQDVFQQLLVYLYSDEAPVGLVPNRCVELLEVANRLCLPRLITLVEDAISKQLLKRSNSEAGDTVDCCLRLLEPCKLHNADQLADWCMNYLCTNYNKLCKRAPKLLKSLHPDNQDYLSEHRWPPVWYLKDYDYYEKCLSEREREERHLLKRSSGGFLCFSSNEGRQRRDSNPTSSHTDTLDVEEGGMHAAIPHVWPPQAPRVRQHHRSIAVVLMLVFALVAAAALAILAIFCLHG